METIADTDFADAVDSLFKPGLRVQQYEDGVSAVETIRVLVLRRRERMGVTVDDF